MLPLPTNRRPLGLVWRCCALALWSGLLCGAPLSAQPAPNSEAKAAEGTPVPGAARRISTLAPEKRSLAEAAPYRRFLWVTRWDYRQPEDLTRIFRLAAQARFSDVFFQVRGEGTVFYKTDLEPWAWELSGRGVAGTGANPGWDPLAKAIEEGRRYGMKVHAYMNVMPGWAQKTPAPAATKQLFSVHRSWFMVTPGGTRMDPKNVTDPSYAFLDPALPEVRRYLAALAGDLARRYDIDGIHLDYIRYPFENGDYSSYNPDSLDAFRDRFGGTPQQKPKQWLQFRRDQITATVRAISAAAKAARPGIEISAAIVADPDKRNNLACQSPEVWLREGFVDAVAPMAYTDDLDRFRNFCASFQGDPWNGRVWIGIWAQLDRNPRLLTEVRRAVAAGFSGIAIFSYSDLFPGAKANQRVVDLYQTFVGVAP